MMAQVRGGNWFSRRLNADGNQWLALIQQLTRPDLGYRIAVLASVSLK
jgi:hypothetical protein